MIRYDISYGPELGQVEPTPHFCREWESDGKEEVGCYGTNPNHGMTWRDACEYIARWHEQEAARWRNEPEPETGTVLY